MQMRYQTVLFVLSLDIDTRREKNHIESVIKNGKARE